MLTQWGTEDFSSEEQKSFLLRKKSFSSKKKEAIDIKHTFYRNLQAAKLQIY